MLVPCKPNLRKHIHFTYYFCDSANTSHHASLLFTVLPRCIFTPEISGMPHRNQAVGNKTDAGYSEWEDGSCPDTTLCQSQCSTLLFLLSETFGTPTMSLPPTPDLCSVFCYSIDLFEALFSWPFVDMLTKRFHSLKIVWLMRSWQRVYLDQHRSGFV